MTIARPTRLLLLAGTLLCVVASCVESRHPLSDEKTSKIDERLIGTWLCEGEPAGWEVKKRARLDNALEVTMPDPHASGRLLVFTTTIKSKSYMSVRDTDGERKKVLGIAGATICEYEFPDKDTLQVRAMEPNVIEKAIADKTLEGESKVKTGRFLFIFWTWRGPPIIAAPPQAIARYLEAHADECYPAKTDAIMTWKRKK